MTEYQLMWLLPSRGQRFVPLEAYCLAELHRQHNTLYLSRGQPSAKTQSMRSCPARRLPVESFSLLARSFVASE